MDKKIFSMVKRLHYDFRFINIIDHDNVVKEASNLLKKSIFSNDFSFRYKIDKTITRKSNIYLRKINLIKKTTNKKNIWSNLIT